MTRTGADPKTSTERRHLRFGRFRDLVGRKVVVSTNDFHHAAGTFAAFEDDGTLRLKVGGRDVALHERDVARIHEADPAQADYIK